MILITWNIQYGKGTDGRIDFRRIVETAAAEALFSVPQHVYTRTLLAAALPATPPPR